ncbi:hypothetical protein FSP39_003824 [Pinctada imbricata]|uniref:O-acyltransferase n=1 Tax=Pinctada imbricata TaxID=66713 RepID=A0AA88YAW3_PINIB|nr:hypothetical protein FSP39_003824 [Pinctada imbricata]
MTGTLHTSRATLCQSCERAISASVTSLALAAKFFKVGTNPVIIVTANSLILVSFIYILSGNPYSNPVSGGRWRATGEPIPRIPDSAKGRIWVHPDLDKKSKDELFKQQIKLMRIKNQAQELKKALLSSFSQELDEAIENFVSEVDQIDETGQNNNNSFANISARDLFEINHVKTIYHMFVAILIVFSLNTLVFDIVNTGRLNLNFELIQWALGGFPRVMSLWVCMQLSTLIVVYPLFNYWVSIRKPGKVGSTDLIALCVYIAYQTAFFIYPIYYVKEHSLPPGSVVVVMCEQLRFMMKVHAFVRENASKVLQVKKDDNQDACDTLCPDFSKYLYFLFVPTLVYRDHYPRDLFEINHVKTIYHMFVAILIVFSLNTLVFDIVNTGRLNLNFELIQWALGGFPRVMSLWVCMQLSTLIVVYPLFNYWVSIRKPGKVGSTDLIALCVYIAYQTAFFIYPIYYVKEHSLPPGSVVVVMCEQLRFMMKVHAFVRENASKVLQVKKDDNQDACDTLCPDFSKYLYFLFVPTLVYRDHYPRTKTINWNYVVSNFAQVLGCLFYTYYIFERFCVPVFHNFNQEHVAPKQLLVSAFGSMLPGTLVLFLGFFGVLHSWFNAFAEMLRFADRQFYKDWWNSTSFSMYYRTWNVVVHDWLYSYIYKDFMKLLGPKNKAGAMALVFLISAVFHEYVLIVSFDFFYPVLFVMFMGAGFGFIFIKDDGSRPWNVFLWVSLFIGNGLLMCLYSMEWYARKRCPVTTVSMP